MVFCGHKVHDLIAIYQHPGACEPILLVRVVQVISYIDNGAVSFFYASHGLIPPVQIAAKLYMITLSAISSMKLA